jgi:SPP1 gp7 family putative phage head morphogenesis protein
MNQYDPTKTMAIRNAFSNQMKKRFADLKAAIKLVIVDQDVFGLTNITTHARATDSPGLGNKAFQFLTKQEKVEGFMEWLKDQEQKGLLKVATLPQVGASRNEAWTNMYVEDSYKRGVMRSRYEMEKAGITVPNIESTGGIQASMSTPFHIDRVGMLYTRAFEGLKDITTTMDRQISNVLGQGMIDGDGPALLARKLNAVISGGGETLGISDTLGRFIPAERRAMILARTEVIRAHHQGMVQEYRNWGMEDVKVQAEFRDAGDLRVCPECQSLDGRVFSLDDIEGMIPVHPQCRCIALPKVVKGKRDKKVKETSEESLFQNSAMDTEYNKYKKDYDKFWNERTPEERAYLLDPTKKYDHDTLMFKERLKHKIEKEMGDIYNAGKDWRSSTYRPDPMRLKNSAIQIEKGLTDFTGTEAQLKEYLLHPENMIEKSNYLRMKAFNQAYMEWAGVEENVILYRGVGGSTGESMAKAIQNLEQQKRVRTKWDLVDMPLSGYTDNPLVAHTFGADYGGIDVKVTIPRKDIFWHKDLLGGLDGRLDNEAEYILLGRVRKVKIGDIKYKKYDRFKI